jgi:hypothetical protein
MDIDAGTVVLILLAALALDRWRQANRIRSKPKHFA